MMDRVCDVAMTTFFVLGSCFFMKALGVVPLLFAFFTAGQ